MVAGGEAMVKGGGALVKGGEVVDGGRSGGGTRKSDVEAGRQEVRSNEATVKEYHSLHSLCVEVLAVEFRGHWTPDLQRYA